MEFRAPLLQGKLIKRYKRFFADVELNGEKITAHVPNTGSMKGCSDPGSACLVSRASDPERKLQFTLEAIQSNHQWVGVNTSWPNKLAIELFKEKHLPHWKKFDSIQSEVKISDKSRVDLVLWSSQSTSIKKWKKEDFSQRHPVHFVEIKNVTLKEKHTALFPDAVTERGQKHIQELVNLIKRGFTAEILFIVQRTDVEDFEPAKEIDPDYAQLLHAAAKEGLRVTAISFEISKRGFQYHKTLKLKPF